MFIDLHFRSIASGAAPGSEKIRCECSEEDLANLSLTFETCPGF